MTRRLNELYLRQLVEPVLELRMDENVAPDFYEKIDSPQALVSAVLRDGLHVHGVYRCCARGEAKGIRLRLVLDPSGYPESRSGDTTAATTPTFSHPFGR